MVTAAVDVKRTVLFHVAIGDLVRLVEVMMAVRMQVVVVRADYRVAIFTDYRFAVQAVHSVHVVPHCSVAIYKTRIKLKKKHSNWMNDLNYLFQKFSIGTDRWRP